MYSCNIILKNNPAWVQLKCVDAITILKYLSTKMTYINNKNNRKLTPSEKAHARLLYMYICLNSFSHWLILSIIMQNQNPKPEENEWTPSLCQLVHVMSILSGCEILCYLLIMFRYQVPTLIFFILQYKDNSLLN